jgi:ribonuclease P protein component
VVTTTIEYERGQKEYRSHRLPRESRLLDEKAYSRVFSQARRSRDTLFTVLYRRSEASGQSASGARLGLAISKKNCRLAVGRNRIKRIVRESFRLHQQALQGVDVVVLNKPKTHEATNTALFASLTNHWQACQDDTPNRAR